MRTRQSGQSPTLSQAAAAKAVWDPEDEAQLLNFLLSRKAEAGGSAYTFSNETWAAAEKHMAAFPSKGASKSAIVCKTKWSRLKASSVNLSEIKQLSGISWKDAENGVVDPECAAWKNYAEGKNVASFATKGLPNHLLIEHILEGQRPKGTGVFHPEKGPTFKLPMPPPPVPKRTNSSVSSVPGTPDSSVPPSPIPSSYKRKYPMQWEHSPSPSPSDHSFSSKKRRPSGLDGINLLRQSIDSIGSRTTADDRRAKAMTRFDAIYGPRLGAARVMAVFNYFKSDLAMCYAFFDLSEATQIFIIQECLQKAGLSQDFDAAEPGAGM